MVTRKQRLGYAISTGIFFLFGAAVYEFCFSSIGPQFIWVIGGVLFGGLISGFILLHRFFKKPRSKKLKVAACILFPMTFAISVFVGVYSFLPYYISNLVILLRTKAGGDSLRDEVLADKVNNITWIASICLLIASVAGIYLYSYLSEANISKEITAQTGFRAGTPDFVAIRDFYYDPKNPGYAVNRDYEYYVDDGLLFILAKNNNTVGAAIAASNRLGAFSAPGPGPNVPSFSGVGLRADLDRLFTGVWIESFGDRYAFVLTIDARADAGTEHRDNTYVDPNQIRLTDENGNPIQSLSVDGGQYTVFCGTVKTGDTNFKVSAMEQNQTATLLTYDDITQCKVLAGN